jgi:ribosome assembly protein YihI (activator of Der GTPase)
MTTHNYNTLSDAKLDRIIELLEQILAQVEDDPDDYDYTVSGISNIEWHRSKGWQVTKMDDY